LYSFSQHGKVANGLLSSCNIFLREYIVGMLHRLVVAFMVLCFWLFYLSSLLKIEVCGALEAFRP
jgi:hypothetical protein